MHTGCIETRQDGRIFWSKSHLPDWRRSVKQRERRPIRLHPEIAKAIADKRFAEQPDSPRRQELFEVWRIA